MTTLSESTTPLAVSEWDPYRGAVIVLGTATLLGTVAAIVVGRSWGNVVFLDLAVTMAIASAILLEIAVLQTARERPTAWNHVAAALEGTAPPDTTEAQFSPPADRLSTLAARLAILKRRLPHWLSRIRQSDKAGLRTAVVGFAAIWAVTFFTRELYFLPGQTALIGAGACVLAAAMAAVATHYLIEIDSPRFPEAPALAQATRVIAWALLLTAASVGLAWAAGLGPSALFTPRCCC